MDDNEPSNASDRIKHVVVLALENRSFDHLLGFLNHPSGDFERLTQGDYPNVTGLADPKEWGVTSDGRHVLQRDPPHGHASVMAQLGRRGPGGGSKMNGFVKAYALKVGGREEVPVIHWFRVALLALPLALVVGGLFNLNPIRDAPTVVIVAVVLFTGIVSEPLRRIQKLVGFAPWIVWLAPVVIGYVLVAGTWGGIARLADDLRAGLLFWMIAYFVLCIGIAIASIVVDRKLRKVSDDAGEPSTRLRIMKCMQPSTVLPVLSKLATEYAICTRWFSSVPGATWPNRNFMHAATSDRSVDIELGFYESKTVFQLLDEAGVGTPNAPAWRLYHDDTPQLIAYPYVWDVDHLPRWHPIEDLPAHAQHDELAPYSFIEPRHSGGHTTSQHPGNNETNSPDDDGTAGNDFRRSERLIRDVYNALRPRLHDTMLVITYDEHGGFFDHVAPPRSPPPKPIKRRKGRVLTRSRLIIGWFIEHRNTPFHFRRYGVRVPAVVISNWIAPGTLVDDRIFDHTSVVATLRRLFAPAAEPLTVRDKRANTLEYLVLDSSSCRPNLPDLPNPPGDDGGPSADPSVRPPASPPPSAAGASAPPRRPPPTRTNDGARRARPTVVRVDADLTDQLKFLSEQVDERLDDIERRYGVVRREVVPSSVGERLRRAAQAGRDAGFGSEPR